MTVYIVCKSLGMIYAVHALESDAIEDARKRNEAFLSSGRFTVEKWQVLGATDHLAREKELVEALREAQRLLSVCEFSAPEDIEAIEHINKVPGER